MTATLFFALIACHEGVGKDDAVGSDSAGLSDDTSGDTSSDTDVTGDAEISGTVRVQLVELDAEGDFVREVSWDEAGGTFAYGAIFVGAYTRDPFTGAMTYLDTYTVAHPSTEGDAYSFRVRNPDGADVWVHAVLDKGADGILGTDEPSTVVPNPYTLVPLSAYDDADLVIETSWDGPPGTGGGDGSGDGGTGADDSVTLSGAGDVTGWPGGVCYSMVYGTDDSGPHGYDAFTPSGDSSTAVGTWSFDVSANTTYKLIGACDANANMLIDPSDMWGAYTDAGGANNNPLSVGTDDRADLPVSIPLVGVSSTTTASVTLSGHVNAQGGFSSWPSGTELYVSFMRTQATGDTRVSDFAFAYDFQKFEYSELTGDKVEFSLEVPPNKLGYLVAWADTDGDGVVNEPGEPIGGHNGNGRLSVGRTSQTGLTLSVQAYTP